MASNANGIRLKIAVDTNWKRVLGSCLLVLTWLYTNIFSIGWLFQSLMSASSFNLVLVSVGAIALSVQFILHRQRLILSARAVFRPAPLLLMLGTLIIATASDWIIDLDQIHVILFLLGTYGLLGLFLFPTVWRKGLPAASLISCVLPFCLQFNTGLGFPVRILTAHAVEYLLSLWNITAISSGDIIVLENAIAFVDIPCSGLKSLWMGTIFLLAATWIENRQIGWRWLLVAGSTLILLVWTNIIRVFSLVFVVDVIKQQEIGEMLHIPLGLVGFVIACFLGWLMLRFVPHHQQKPRLQQKQELKQFRPAKLSTQATLCALIIGLALIPQPQDIQTQPLSLTSLQLPQQLQLEPISLTKTEGEFFANYPNTVAQKERFVWGDLSGSMLMVGSTSWRVNHAPELCLVASGFEVNKMEKKQLTPDVLGRWLSLDDGAHSATYWFQSAQKTTDDLLVRIWGEVTRQDSSWVLVSILFDRPQNPDSSEIRNFSNGIHDAIAQGFEHEGV